MKNNFSKYSKVFILFLSVASLAQSMIYQTINSKGEMLFSDKKTANSTQIKLKTANSYTPTQQTKSLDSKKQNNKSKPKDKKISLITPVDQQTIQNQREILATVKMDVALEPGESIAWWLDGTLYQQNTNTQITITELARGEHHLQAKRLDSKNNILMTTQTVVFYVQLQTDDSPTTQ